MRGALWIAPLLGLGGCGLTCTLMYAPSMTGVEFETAAWAPGTYEIEASGYTEHAMCVVTLPYVEGDRVICTGNATLDLNEAGDAVERIALSEYSPPTFTIQIEGDDGPVAEGTFTPDYEVDEPNGPGCGERHRATVTMSF